MSSLAASRADNFYHPPDWDPTKESRKKFQRSSGHNQYEKHGVIRFELPYDGWCLGCDRHYGKGTRFNAKKEHDGHYFSTKIWKFTMRCHSCQQEIVVATDPKNTDYDFRVGLKKKEEEFSVDSKDGVDARIQDNLDSIYKVGGHKAEQERHDRKTNAIYKLEHERDDRVRAKTESELLDQLVDESSRRTLFNYDANAVLRETMRNKRRLEATLKQEGESKGLAVPLLPRSDEDQSRASSIMHSAPIAAMRRGKSFREAERKQLRHVRSGSIFGSASTRHEAGIKTSELSSKLAGSLAHSKSPEPTTHRDAPIIRKRKRKARNRAATSGTPTTLLVENYDSGSDG